MTLPNALLDGIAKTSVPKEAHARKRAGRSVQQVRIDPQATVISICRPNAAAAASI